MHSLFFENEMYQNRAEWFLSFCDGYGVCFLFIQHWTVSEFSCWGAVLAKTKKSKVRSYVTEVLKHLSAAQWERTYVLFLVLHTDLPNINDYFCFAVLSRFRLLGPVPCWSVYFLSGLPKLLLTRGLQYYQSSLPHRLSIYPCISQ